MLKERSLFGEDEIAIDTSGQPQTEVDPFPLCPILHVSRSWVCIANYADWLSCMPDETQRYVAAIGG
jgi:hypothetical protein